MMSRENAEGGLTESLLMIMKSRIMVTQNTAKTTQRRAVIISDRMTLVCFWVNSRLQQIFTRTQEEVEEEKNQEDSDSVTSG